MSAAVVMAIFCSHVFGQSGAASIQGKVTDSTGAVVVGASVSILNQETGLAVEAKTSSVGFYQVPSLFTGRYVVSISAPNMETSQRSIELLVGQIAVINSTLAAGSVTQKIDVKANAVQLVDTTDGTLSATLEDQRINELPMNGRNIISLVNETTPGLEPCPESPPAPTANPARRWSTKSTE